MNTSLRSLLSREANIVFCNVFDTILYYSQFVTSINFVYRYFGVVHNRPLTGREYCGMLATLMMILASIFVWDYVLNVRTDETEFVMTEEYSHIFGGQNVTSKGELRTCIRGNMVTRT
jgi:hypothetical protein